MRKRFVTVTIMLAGLFSAAANAADFGAYYTKINSGESFERDSRTSEFTDTVVDLRENERFVFWRGSSYLPYWQRPNGKWYVAEEIPRSGDGTSKRPDNVNTYSQVEIIESNNARIVVRWRYVPNFDTSYNISPGDWAVEYFTVYPDGVLIRTVRQCTATLEDWEDPNNLIVRELRLESNGINNLPSVWKAIPELTLTGSSAPYYVKEDFDQRRRSYVLKLNRNGRPQTLTFSLESGARNPVVLVKNWGQADVSGVKINSQASNDYRIGYEYTFDGADLVVWFNKQSNSPIDIEITPASYIPPENKAPTVNAGEDQSMLVASGSSGPYSFTLGGLCEDDGLPNASVDVNWEQVCGPGKVTFSSPNALTTKVAVSTDGLYVLRLTVNDGALAGTDDLRIVVDKDPGSYGSPIVWWKFNESAGNKTKDSVSGIGDKIQGYFKRVQGVVGNCLKFSEFDTYIERNASSAPDINTSVFTIEAWVAPRSYPWNWCPIVMQKSSDSGFYFGVDAHSRFGLWVYTADGWHKCNTSLPFDDDAAESRFSEYATAKGIPETTLPLLKWSHIVGTFNKAEGIKLYLNGELVKSLSFSGNLIKPDTKLYIGRDAEKIKPANSTEVTPKINYSFDGLIDEIKIYNTCLIAQQVKNAYNHAQPKIVQSLEYKSVPKGPDGPGTRFRLYHTSLKLDEDFDRRFHVSEHADKVLLFDEYDFKIVWWHGIAYYPIQYAANGIGMQHEAVETHGKYGCEEALMDKQCRYAKVKVIENTDARVVVEFRSAGNDLYYNITHKQPDGWGCWSDDLWTVYPDGTVARRITLWCSEQERWHSYEQENYVIPPGLRPVDILHLEANTVANLKGEVSKLNWKSGWPEGKHISLGAVKTYNIKANAWPFAIVIPGLHDICNADNEDTPLEGTRRPYPYCFPWWDHWPIEQIPCDGRVLFLVNGHFSSTCTGAIIMDKLLPAEQKAHPFIEGTDVSVTVPFMFGMTPVESTPAATALKLLPLAKMYINPPSLTDTIGCSSEGYNRFKHEYRITREADTMSFKLNGSSDSPIVNPCFAIKNWGNNVAGLKINGLSVTPGPNFRQGIIRDTDGEKTLVVWLKADQRMTNFELRTSKLEILNSPIRHSTFF